MSIDLDDERLMIISLYWNVKLIKFQSEHGFCLNFFYIIHDDFLVLSKFNCMKITNFFSSLQKIIQMPTKSPLNLRDANTP